MTEQNPQNPAGEPCIPLSEIRQELGRLLAAESGVIQLQQELSSAAPHDNPTARISHGVDTFRNAGALSALDEISAKIVAWLDAKELDN